MKNEFFKRLSICGLVLAVVLSVFIQFKPDVIVAQEAQSIRVHIDTDLDYETLGLWVWGDVKTPSENNPKGWPLGAQALIKSEGSDYAYHTDIIMNENAKRFNFLINNKSGDNLSGDLGIDVISKDMDEIWIDKDFGVHMQKPNNLQNNMIRIHYLHTDNNYNDYGMWVWDKLVNENQNTWPSDALKFDDNPIDKNGSYIDIPLNEDENVEGIGFLIVKLDNSFQTSDFKMAELGDLREIYIRSGDATIYDNPYYVIVNRLISAELLTDHKILLSTNDPSKFTVEALKEGLVFLNSEDKGVNVDFDIEITEGKIYITGDFTDIAFDTIKYEETKVNVLKSWKYKDNKYFYEGDLGATLFNDGSASLKLWSPSADRVSVVLYDKTDQSKIVKSDIQMSVNDKGVWSVLLNKETTGIDNLNSYLYHYEIDRAGVKTLVLDPYAKSLGQWDNKNDLGHKIAKAAIIDPSNVGPELDYAKVPGYESREDAIIYELHVRDFTSDPTLDGNLVSKYGTFSSFVERLDYLQDLGITHVQLLPVMSYYFANEFTRETRMLEYESEDTDYNWGYDPQSYFALTGMYSEDPSNPELRVLEFKNLVNEIHKRGMGIILDVVYNHTANVSIFEDLEPNYYHFMNADGSSRTSFGGGRLGTTHLMTRRILIDSILFMVSEYKIDGFRFDMMGDHDAQTIQMAYDEAKKLNPNILMIGEGWVTYAGDEGEPNQSADQNWMKHTDAVGSFSDEIRNELKSGFGSEGQPRFLTNGKRNINTIFQNMIANPSNFHADDAGDVVQYIEAHDNLTLYDVIAQSIKKDPAFHDSEILSRVRLGNTMILTAQGTPFLHGGQEYGRTKQFMAPTDSAPYKSTFMTDLDGKPFKNPYFIHDSYDSSDIINRFEWNKVNDEKSYPENVLTKDHMKGMISLRKSTDAYSYDHREDIEKYVSLIESKDIQSEDLVLAMKNISKSTGDIYYLFVNADESARTIHFESETIDLDKAIIISDGNDVDLKGIKGTIQSNMIELEGLSSRIIKVSNTKETPKVDKTKLEALIKEASALDLSKYETLGADALKSVLSQSIEKILDQNISQTSVDALTLRLETAIKNLVLKDEAIVDKNDSENEDLKGENLPETGITNKSQMKQISLILIACGFGIRMINKKRKQNQ